MARNRVWFLTVNYWKASRGRRTCSHPSAELHQASGATILVTLGPQPQLDIWQKALAVKALIPDLRLVRVSVSDAPLPEGVVEFATALAARDGKALISGNIRRT